MRFIFSLAFALLFAGCANNPSLAPQGSTNTATITGQEIAKSWYRWRVFALEAIDEKQVNHSFLTRDCRTVTTVEAGLHRLLINGSFNDLQGGTPKKANIVLTADIQPGKAYRLNGEARDNLLVTWLENPDTGEKLSSESSAPYMAARGPAPIYIPPMGR